MSGGENEIVRGDIAMAKKHKAVSAQDLQQNLCSFITDIYTYFIIYFLTIRDFARWFT